MGKKVVVKDDDKKEKYFADTDITSILTKSVEKLLGSTETEDEEDDEKESKANKSIQKSIKGLTANVQALTEFVAKNIKIEKPKTTEEVVKEMLDSFKADILGKKKTEKSSDKKEDDKEDDSDEESLEGKTVGDLKSIMKDALKVALKDIVINKDSVKGKKKKNDSEQAIDDVLGAIAKTAGLNYADEDDSDDKDEDAEDDKDDDKDDEAGKDSSKGDKELTCETHDTNGDELSKEERSKRQKLDDFMGERLSFRYKQIGKDKED